MKKMIATLATASLLTASFAFAEDAVTTAPANDQAAATQTAPAAGTDATATKAAPVKKHKKLAKKAKPAEQAAPAATQDAAPAPAEQPAT